MAATTSLVSATARCVRFLSYGVSGDLRHSPLLTVNANVALDLLFGDLPYIFVRNAENLKSVTR